MIVYVILIMAILNTKIQNQCLEMNLHKYSAYMIVRITAWLAHVNIHIIIKINLAPSVCTACEEGYLLENSNCVCPSG